MSDGPTRVRRVALPERGGPPYRVFVNGEEVVEGEGWDLDGGAVRFVIPLRPQPPLGLWSKTLLSLGIGVYGDLRGDNLDVMVTTEDGETEVVSAVPIREAD